MIQVTVNDKRLKVGSVLVRFRSGTGAVKAIHVYDGEKKIAGKDNLNLKSSQWHVERVDVPGDPEIHWGLGISILVDLGPDDPWVEFRALFKNRVFWVTVSRRKQAKFRLS